MKLRTAAEKYVEEFKLDLAARTSESYLHHVNRWERLTDDPDITDIEIETVNRFRQAHTEAGLSPMTFQSSWRNVRTILGYAVGKGWVKSVPKIRHVKARKKRPVVPAWNILSVMYNNADKTVWPVLSYCSTEQFWQSWLAVSYWTGLRLGDMKTLRASDYSPTEWTLESTANKTSKDHIYPVPSWLGRHIEAMRGAADGRLFSVPTWSDNRIRRELAVMCGGANPVSPQQIRRLSINMWAGASSDAGKIIHGTGLGVLEFYYEDLVILRAAAPAMPVPDCMTKAPAALAAG